MMLLPILGLGMLLLFASILPTFFSMDEFGASGDPRVLARQMVIYHASATRKCGTSACSGVVDPSDGLPSFADASVYGDGRLRSIATTDDQGRRVVVTFLRDAPTIRSTAVGTMSATLADQIGDTGAWLGRLDRAASRVVASGRMIWNSPAQGSTIAVSAREIVRDVRVPVPAGQMVDVPDSAPVLVSRLG